MQTVRTFRKLRGGRQGRERHSTSYELIDARGPGAEGPDVGRGGGQGEPSVPEEVWGAAPGRRPARGRTGRGTAEGSLGQEKTPKPVLPLCLGHACPEAGPPSSCLTSSPFPSLDPPLGPSPLRWLLGSSAKDPGQGRWGGRGAGGSLPGPWLDGGPTEGAQRVPSTCWSEAAAPRVRGPNPAPQCRAPPQPGASPRQGGV